MDLDFAGIDCSWPYDSVYLSASDPLFSPAFAVADFSDDKSAVASTAPDLRILTCNPEATTSNHKNDDDDEDDKRRLPNPFSRSTLLEPSEMLLIKERMTQALRHLKESSNNHQILAQIWAPIKSGNRYVLTTSGQPFVLSRHSNGLHQYRTASLMYSFSVEGETDGNLGLPGRVFRQKLPEWTPDVQYYSSKEYARVKHAKDHNVHGTLALPVFEPSGQSCVGVLELIMTSQKVNYAPDVDKVCKALEVELQKVGISQGLSSASIEPGVHRPQPSLSFGTGSVNLRSSKISDQPSMKICNEGRQNALVEILEVFTEVCESYNLPLAQTWIPCRHKNILAYGGGLKKSCSSFDGSCMEQVCMSTTDVAFYVVDAHLWGFHEACAEHHLQQGQGVAGRAFSSKGSCFSQDISRFCKKEYPLVHYAKMFGLTSCFAICLRSKYTGEDDYVLEFFLPNNLTDSSDQQMLIDSILQIMKMHFRSLMAASGRALEGERSFMEIVALSRESSPELEVKPVPVSHPSDRFSMMEQSDGGAISSLETYDELFEEKVVLEERKDHNGEEFLKPSGRKRGKAEKQISLEVLQQYFAGSLKDAAKSLGVCPTTMKRICRQHGIPRWPSRKINKVNRSLSKLKLVMESVQCADGVFSFSSLSPHYTPTATVAPISWPTGPDHEPPSPTSKPIEPTGLKTDPHPEPHPAQDRSGSTETSTGTSTSNESSQTSPDNHHLGNSMALMFQSSGEINFSAAFLNTGSVIVKAAFKEDTIRFRFSLESNIVGLRYEVAKRLRMEVGTFDIRYLVDDNEQFMINYQSDLQDCLEMVRSTGKNVIRLSIHEIVGNLGSSCESTDQ